ncbi:phage portal protein [Desulfobaculum bizertense]|uniref:phage portal protein n=1 Tax=Desulfobaculum bizertense TaxID=376490 RepID=UPI001F18F2D7|nr:phage portal protein [Desulfobaculum bizertense]UIJ38717.1 phage portal protein [Desulfobaculum bizertense]
MSATVATAARRTRRAVRFRVSHSRRPVSRDAGTLRGTLSKYDPRRTSLSSVAAERARTLARSEDLVANDWAAASVVDSITVNTIGSGLRPQSHVNALRLGISPEDARKLGEDMEWAWQLWNRQAHVSGKLHFDDLVFLGMRSLLRCGELVHIPVMLPSAGRDFALCIQDIHPARLCTPSDRRLDTSLHDGVEISPYGQPLAYWIASPRSTSLSRSYRSLASSEFQRLPAATGHRPGVFHCFRAEEEEQVRGVSRLAPGMKLFRHLNDSLDYELMAQIVSASFPVFISVKDPNSVVGAFAQEEDEAPGKHYQYLEPGQVLYGNKNEEPTVLQSNRPGSNFTPFAEMIMRAMAASVGMPYEVLAKDYSKTNYSSARAALLEAWRVFMLYRTWIVRHYCQPIWRMVQEEAWLRGMYQLPKGAPDFYEAIHAYTNASWIGPARGYVDPVKEITATREALDLKLCTHSEVVAERGQDLDEVWDQIEREQQRLRKMESGTEERDDNSNE